MHRFTALFILTRPVNCLLTALSVGVGALTAGVCPSLTPVLLAACTAALITAAGNAFNDVIDLEVDRINRPTRPLPAGLLSLRTARLAALLLSLTGWILAWLLSPVHVLIASVVIAGLFFYSMYLKNSVLWGNVSIGFIAAAAFPYGALAAGAWGRSWIPAGFALLFHVGREIVKDIEDVEGDRARNVQTLPLRRGRPQAGLIASTIYLFLIGFTLLPWITDLYSWAYLGPVCLVDLLVIYVLVCLYHRRAALTDDRLGRLLKVGMLLGLLAIAAGELTF